MPQNPTQSAFTGQSLRGMELDVKLEAQGTATWACIFAATAFDVQVAAATTSRQHTLNKGSRTSTGAAGEITATCDVFVVPDSPGQWAINQAFRSGAKVDIRRCMFAGKVGDDVTLASGATEKSIQILPSPPASGATPATQINPLSTTGLDGVPEADLPKSGGFIRWVDKDSAGNNPLKTLLADAEPGMTLQVGTSNYFIGYRAPDSRNTAEQGAVLFVSPSPIVTGGTTTAIAGYPYIGAAVAKVMAGTVRLYRGRVETTMYKGTVTVPVVATDAAPGDDGNDLSTAQISFALDDIGTPTYDPLT